MLNGRAALNHRIGPPIKPIPHAVQNVLVLPSGNPALLTRRAMLLQRAALAGVRPMATQDLTALCRRHAQGVGNIGPDTRLFGASAGRV